jgi:uncharacterized protein
VTSELRLPYCQGCDRVLEPGLHRCPRCLSQALDQRPASGRGTLYSHVVVWRPAHPDFDPPYVVAVVELEEGPRIVASVADVSTEDLVAGIPLEVAWDAAADPPPLVFRPSAAQR